MYVIVEDTIFTDRRFDVLAAELGCSRDAALVRMLRVWLHCTVRERIRVSAESLAPLLLCEPARVVRALRRARLGEPLPGRQIAICVRAVPSLQHLVEDQATCA